MNTNTLRRLNWLWKHRHTHDDDNIAEQLTIITGEIQQQVDAVAGAENGARIHLTRTATQSIGVGGEAIDWDTSHIPPVGFDGATPLPRSDLPVALVGYYNVHVTLGWASWTGGGSVWVTRERDGAEQTMWPPADDPDVWTAIGASRFSNTAPAIPCRAGDLIRVYVDAEDASAQDLASATLALYLVERAPDVTGPILVTPGVAVRPASPTNEVFHDAEYELFYTSGTVMVSRESDGTGAYTVDNAIDIYVNGVLEHTDFTDPPAARGPTDIASFLNPGANTVRIVLRDQSGVNVSSTSIWIVPEV